MVVSDAAPFSVERLRLNQACVSCSILKVRCAAAPAGLTSACKRCSEKDISCERSTVRVRRKPKRRKVGRRLEELAERVHDIQLRLQSLQERSGRSIAKDVADGVVSGTMTFRSSFVVSGPAEDSASLIRGSITPSLQLTSVPRSIHPHAQHDVIDRGILSEIKADQLVVSFRIYLERQLFGFYLSENFTWFELRRLKPILWLSALYAASSISIRDSALANRLHDELIELFDRNLFSRGEACLDLLQALRNFIFFNHQPVYARKRHIVGYIKTAVHMAIRLGQGLDFSSLSLSVTKGSRGKDEQVQICRELLIWYWGSFIIMMKKRQPNMMTNNDNLVRQSIHVLETSSNQHDLRLVSWVKTARVARDTTNKLVRGFTSTSGGLDDASRDEIVQTFNDSLMDCAGDRLSNTSEDQFKIEYYQYILFLYGIKLPKYSYSLLIPEFSSELLRPAGKLELDEFRRREVALPSLDQPTDIPCDLTLLAGWRLAYTKMCVGAAQSILNIFVSIETDRLRRLTTYAFSRPFVALHFLCQLSYHIYLKDAENIVSLDCLDLDTHIGTLFRALSAASSGGLYTVPTLWLHALETKILPWQVEFNSRARKWRAHRYMEQVSQTAQNQAPAWHRFLPISTLAVVDMDQTGGQFESRDVFTKNGGSATEVI